MDHYIYNNFLVHCIYNLYRSTSPTLIVLGCSWLHAITMRYLLTSSPLNTLPETLNLYFPTRNCVGQQYTKYQHRKHFALYSILPIYLPVYMYICMYASLEKRDKILSCLTSHVPVIKQLQQVIVLDYDYTPSQLLIVDASSPLYLSGIIVWDLI